MNPDSPVQKSHQRQAIERSRTPLRGRADRRKPQDSGRLLRFRRVGQIENEMDACMTSTLFALLLFLAPLAYSPGPGNLFFAALGARYGTLATIPANLGYHVATWWVTLAVGFGLFAVLSSAPALFAVMKIAGSLYVLWIALQMWGDSEELRSTNARRSGFRDGAVLLLLNPKAYVIMGLMFSQFLDPDAPAQIGLVLLITTVFTINNFCAFTLWTVAGDRLARVLAAPHRARALNRVFATLLGLVAVWMFVA